MDLMMPINDLRQGVREALLSPVIDLTKKVSTPPELLLFLSSSGGNPAGGGSEYDRHDSSTQTTTNIQNSQQFRSSQPTHAIDAWQFGCLLYTLFSPSHTLTQRSDLKNVHTLPKPLHEHYIRLVSASPQNRLTLNAFVTTNTYFVNPLCEACQFLETIQLKEQYEKENFWRKLPNLLKDIPTTYAKHKILPHLIQAMEFGSGDLSSLFHRILLINSLLLNSTLSLSLSLSLSQKRCTLHFFPTFSTCSYLISIIHNWQRIGRRRVCHCVGTTYYQGLE
jgi:hypothetical protein